MVGTNVKNLHGIPLRMDYEGFVELDTEWISEPGLHIGIEEATFVLSLAKMGLSSHMSSLRSEIC